MSEFLIGSDKCNFKFRIYKPKFLKSRLLAFLSNRLLHPCQIWQLFYCIAPKHPNASRLHKSGQPIVALIF